MSNNYGALQIVTLTFGEHLIVYLICDAYKFVRIINIFTILIKLFQKFYVINILLLTICSINE